MRFDTVLILSAACFILHALVIYKGIVFFRTDARCRDTDKALIATLIGASIAFLIVQGIDWYAHTLPVCMPPRLLSSLWYGFDLLNSVFYLALVNKFSDTRVCRLRSPR